MAGMNAEPHPASQPPAPPNTWPFRTAIAAGACFTLAFVAWSWFALTDSPVSRFDLKLATALQVVADHRTYWRMFFIVCTEAGGIRACIMLSAVGVAWAWRRNEKQFAFIWIAIAAGGGLVNLTLKEVLDRDRPPAHLRDRFVSQTNESYPSGHAMGSLIGYGMWAYVMQTRVRNVRVRGAVMCMLGLWIGMICFSRVFLRAHWLSDVIGGTLIGIAYLTFALTYWELRKTRRPKAAKL
jgi:membrane-associated phospholipid phosphatase